METEKRNDQKKKLVTLVQIRADIQSGYFLKTGHIFYVYGSVHRWSILIIVQRDATQSSLFIILQVHCTCFVRQPHPLSEVHTSRREVAAQKIWPEREIVVKVLFTPGDGCWWHSKHVEWTAWSWWREIAAQKIGPVPEAVVTVLCTPDDGCVWHPKHVEWTAWSFWMEVAAQEYDECQRL